ncbi:MAG: lysine--tRNA ligase [Robiginitomaculum sp.]|nr:MAG: lysine--tRNA ligase [Robiginitomaculum sp.]
MSFSQEIMEKAKAWPFEQARAIVKRLMILEKRGTPHPASTGDGAVIFQTGYGPSGLPHIGTFGEVARTSMVRQAFNALTNNQYKTELIAFSDDMDGLRKIPTNLPNQEMMAEYIGKPLTDVPDPFGTHESFAAHNNAKLREFLDRFGFEYTFISSTEKYRSGAFDETLLVMLERFDKVMDIMLPTLGEERRASYSPFLPISPTTGRVLQVPTLERNVEKGTIVFEDEDGSKVETLVTGGRVKIQWKPDWALRWTALAVDYEMAGKDLIDSTKVSSKICRALGGTPPEGFNYELFNDETGQKISKSKGNGISVEEWLRYGLPESLSLFNYVKPKTAKRLFFDVIPKATDEYFQHLSAYFTQDEAAQINNPVWYIHNGRPPQDNPPVSFALLLNLVSAANASDKDILWGFIENYADGANPADNPVLDNLCEYAVRYYQDFVKPNKNYRAPTDAERAAMQDLRDRFSALDAGTKDAGELQTLIFSVGKDHEFENLRDWFKALYEVLLGQSQGPRFGSFVAIFGLEKTIDLIDTALSGALLD